MFDGKKPVKITMSVVFDEGEPIEYVIVDSDDKNLKDLEISHIPELVPINDDKDGIHVYALISEEFKITKTFDPPVLFT